MSLAPRALPFLPGELPLSSAEVLATVRTWAEWATDSNPHNMLDYSAYLVFQQWCEDESKRAVIVEVVTARLKCETPSCNKALILAQLLPASTISTLLDDLKPLTKGTPGYDVLATTLQSAGEEHKAKAAEAEAEDKWNTWAKMYGEAKAEWPGPPKEPEWGVWAILPVGVEEWWVPPPEEKKDEKA